MIAEVASSNKRRVTIADGKEMMGELNFYIIDVADLGSDTEDDGDDDAAEKEFNRMLMSGGIDEEEAAKNASMVERVMKEMREADAEEDRRRVYEDENTIE